METTLLRNQSLRTVEEGLGTRTYHPQIRLLFSVRLLCIHYGSL